MPHTLTITEHAARALAIASGDKAEAARLLVRWANDDMHLYKALTKDYLTGGANRAVQVAARARGKSRVTRPLDVSSQRHIPPGAVPAAALEAALSRIKTDAPRQPKRQEKNLRTLAKSYLAKKVDEAASRGEQLHPVRGKR